MTYHGMTKIGEEYMAKCLSNKIPIKFTKVKIGNGLLASSENPYNFKDIKNIKKEVSITQITQEETLAKILVIISNEGIQNGFWCSELGIYVDDNGIEKLYWYVNDANECPFIEPENRGPYKLRWTENILVTTQETMIINWNGKDLWVDQKFLEDHQATVEEIRDIFEDEFIYEDLTLATENQIRQLFPSGTKFIGSASFDLSGLNADEASVVTMKLLSLYNDLLQQKINSDKKITVKGTGALEGGGDLTENRIITHKDSSGYKHIPTGGETGQYLKYFSDGVATWGKITQGELGLEEASIDEIKIITFF